MSTANVEEELERLGKEVQGCTRCDLHCNTIHGVPGEGQVDARVMLVGEAPGFNEDKQGRPFVGAAGKFLDNVLLPHAGLRRADVYITNVVKHRPPNNRDPMPDELKACLPYLERQIKLIQPDVIVTLGRFSLGTFFPGDMISRVHGQVRQRNGQYYFHMYHPAAALHQDKLRQTLEDDMKRLGEFLKGPKTQGPQAQEKTEEPEEHEPQQLSLF